MKVSGMLLAMVLGCAMMVGHVQAQSVPYFAFGVGVGNLNTFEASGRAVGFPLGRFSYVTDATSVTQFAADGSQLNLVRVELLELEITDLGNGKSQVRIVETLEIVDGTGRFRNASADGLITSTVLSVPFDPSDVTAIPFVFSLDGRINLGKRRR